MSVCYSSVLMPDLNCILLASLSFSSDGRSLHGVGAGEWKLHCTQHACKLTSQCVASPLRLIAYLPPVVWAVIAVWRISGKIIKTVL